MSVVFPAIEVEDEVRGDEFNYKASCRVGSTQDTNWTTSASAAFADPTLTITGLSTGTTLGLIDSTEPTTGDRVLLKDLGAISAGAAGDDGFNGIWEVTGGTTTSLTLVRAYDLQVGDSALAVTAWIREGTVNAVTAWISTSNVTISDAVADDVVFDQYDVRGVLSIDRGGTGTSSLSPGNRIVQTNAGATALETTTTPVVTQLLDTNLAELIIFNATGAAVNEFTISNAATGNAPIFQSSGEANIGMIISDSNSNELLIFNSTAAAVNEVSITNAATGTAPIIASSGETNVDLEFNTAGTGSFVFGAGDAATSAEIRLEDNTGGQYAGITVPAAITTSYSLILPGDTGTAGQVLTTDGNNPAALSWSSVAVDNRHFCIFPLEGVANSINATEISQFAFDDSQFGSYTTRTCYFWHENVTNRDLTVEIFQVGTGVIGTTTIASPAADALASFTFTNPGADSRLTLRVNKSANGGTNPRIFGVHILMN